MTLITIDAARCAKDGLCDAACPMGLINQDGDALPVEVADARDACVRCGHCVAVCPTGALTNALMPTEDFLPVERQLLPGPEQTEALLRSRRSVRGFKDAPVPRETLERLLETARRAPTASNTQQVSWIIIQDRGLLDTVIRLTVDWMRTMPARARYVALSDAGRDMTLRGAPALALAHCPKDWRWTDGDCAIALTYMELAAASLGLGACWAGLVTAASDAVPELRQTIGLPEDHRVGGGLMLGLPRYRYRLVPPRNPARVAWR